MANPLKYNKALSVHDVRIQRKGDIDRYNGLTVKKIASAVFDTGDTDSSGVSNTTIAAHGTGVYIPDNAIITKVHIDVITTFESATDAATMAISALGANDIVSAVAISTGTPWDAGQQAAIPVDTPATSIKLTAEKEIVVTVAVEVLTAGKMVIFVEYMQSE